MVSYIHLERLGDALDRIAGRFSRGDKFMRAVTEIEANDEALEKDFFAFFPDLARYCAQWKQEACARCSPNADRVALQGVREAWTGRVKGHSASVGREHAP